MKRPNSDSLSFRARLVLIRHKSRWLPLAVILLVGVAWLPDQAAKLRASWPTIRRWAERVDQYQLMEEAPIGALLTADNLLPETAAVLLVTSGRGIRHAEYTLYHRALYHLAPRPVWWLAPVAPDGTWESRWWISAPLTEAAVHATAAEKGANCLLVYRSALTDDPNSSAGFRRVGGLGQGLVVYESGIGMGCRLASGGARSDGLSFYWPMQLAGALLVIFALGFGFLAVVRRLGYRPLLPEAAALSWLLGAGTLSLAMFWLGWLGLSLTVQTRLLTAAALIVVGLAFLERWRSGTLSLGVWRQLTIKRPAVGLRTFLVGALMLFLALQVCFVALMAVGRPLTFWDSWVNWGMKARIMFIEGGLTPAVYADPSRAVALLDYPLSLPLLQTWLFAWLSTPDDRLAGLPVLFHYLALLALVFSAARRAGARASGGLALTAAVAGLRHFSGLSASVLPDSFLTVLVTSSAVYLLVWLDDGPPGALLLAAVLAGLLPWTKREGLFLAGALGLALLLAMAWERDGRLGMHRLHWPGRQVWWGAAAIGFGVALIAGPWWLFAAQNALSNDAFLPFRLATFLENSHRLLTSARLGVELLLDRHYNGVWLLTGILLLWQWRRHPTWRQEPIEIRHKPGATILWLAPFIYLVGMHLTYVFSAFEPFQAHILSSAFRLVTHAAIMPVLWLGFQALDREAGKGRPIDAS